MRGHPQTSYSSNNERHPQSLPRGREDERLTWMDLMEATRTAQSTMNAAPGTVTCSFGKVCMNQHGLRIHRGKSGCQCARLRGQRLTDLASETQEYPSMDSNHSIEELSIHETTLDVFLDPELEEKGPLLDLLKFPGESSQEATVLSRPRHDSATSQRKLRIKWPKVLDKKSWKLKSSNQPHKDQRTGNYKPLPPLSTLWQRNGLEYMKKK